ncbi:hypothetical protein BpHYR1_044904 [Brachionus plicatilis]|uniref:Uncharacterized protein n=1 Tax=Brachionus plicatilis TaxID=10195 RepID=A0A3M7P2A7_BRAPC|nr:hypothetical protein BpHYR1_044904 [Brachionus plicatilis]
MSLFFLLKFANIIPVEVSALAFGGSDNFVSFKNFMARSLNAAFPILQNINKNYLIIVKLNKGQINKQKFGSVQFDSLWFGSLKFWFASYFLFSYTFFKRFCSDIPTTSTSSAKIDNVDIDMKCKSCDMLSYKI